MPTMTPLSIIWFALKPLYSTQIHGPKLLSVCNKRHKSQNRVRLIRFGHGIEIFGNQLYFGCFHCQGRI
jgi:hypothetical protein